MHKTWKRGWKGFFFWGGGDFWRRSFRFSKTSSLKLVWLKFLSLLALIFFYFYLFILFLRFEFYNSEVHFDANWQFFFFFLKKENLKRKLLSKKFVFIRVETGTLSSRTKKKKSFFVSFQVMLVKNQF